MNSMIILLLYQIHILNQQMAANSVISGGIRTYTKPGTSDTVQVYIRCRKKVKQKSVVSYQKLTMTHNRNKKWQAQN